MTSVFKSRICNLKWLWLCGLLLLPGCTMFPSFVWPWSKDREKPVARAEAKVAEARDDVLRRAQGETTVAAVALRSADDSRPVQIAREATDSASSLQAQAMGPLPEAERQRLEQIVADLLSENAEVRAAAERDRAKDRAENAKLSERLADLNADLESAKGKLRDAYAREKELADRYRSLMWTVYGLAAVAVLLAAGWVYVRITTGGALTRLIGGIEKFKGKHPAIAPTLLEDLSKALDAADKSLVRRIVSEVKP